MVSRKLGDILKALAHFAWTGRRVKDCIFPPLRRRYSPSGHGSDQLYI